jgi:hypothetical protein
MKPRVKEDSWCYTASKKSARKKIKRVTHKAHRRNDREVIAEAKSLS